VLKSSQQAIVISDRTVDLSRELLLDGDGNIVPLRPRAWLVLRFLALRVGRLVSKDELLDEIWSDCEVTEDSLVQAIGHVRRALGDVGRTALRTLPRRGYMLLAGEGSIDPSGFRGTTRSHPSNLGERLRAQASMRFVGRDNELAKLRETLAPEPTKTLLFYLHGPGGIGKTALLEQLRSAAEADGVVLVRFDAAGMSTEPNFILAGLARAYAWNEPVSRAEDLATNCVPPKRNILVIDNVDGIAPAASWLREVLLPALPAQTRVILAGREAPDAHWTGHPMWCESMRCIGVGSLTRDEATRLLTAHGIEEKAHSKMLDLCHGHPLALVLLAAEVRSTDQVPSALGPDLVRALTRRCMDHAPTALHRTALEACARAHTTTVGLLADVVDRANAPRLFDWLSDQSYVRAGPYGLAPHDLVRDAIDEELRWRDPQSSRTLQQKIDEHLIRRMQQTQDFTQAIFELQYLRRHSPFLQRFFAFSALGTISVGPASDADAAGIARIRDAALPRSERILIDLWRNHPAARTLIARGPAGQVCGLTQIIELHRLQDEDAAIDPMVAAVGKELDNALRRAPDGSVTLMSRFTITDGERRTLDPVMNALQLSHYMLWITETALRFYVIVDIDPDEFAPLLEKSGFQRMSNCDRVVDGIKFGCFVHDCEAEPRDAWHDRLANL
jgi:DNA-binding winged helix-turn-helix (wHTH) protein